MNPLHLTHEELINPNAEFVQVLWPVQIPVHPKVYGSEFVYTEEFVNQVMAKVPDSIRQDITVIERMLGKPLGIKVKQDRMIEEGDMHFQMHYRHLGSSANPEIKSVRIEYGATGLGLDTTRLPTIFTPEIDHPMSLDKLRQYAFETKPVLKNHGWYVHNYRDNGMMAQVYMRNFAIVFNNLGLGNI